MMMANPNQPDSAMRQCIAVAARYMLTDENVHDIAIELGEGNRSLGGKRLYGLLHYYNFPVRRMPGEWDAARRDGYKARIARAAAMHAQDCHADATVLT